MRAPRPVALRSHCDAAAQEMATQFSSQDEALDMKVRLEQSRPVAALEVVEAA